MSIPDNVHLKQAKYVRDYVIRFVFSDGRVVDLDFHPVLSDEGQNPMTRQFLDVTRFREFSIVNRRDIIWGDHEMAFPLATLYAGASACTGTARSTLGLRSGSRGLWL